MKRLLSPWTGCDSKGEGRRERKQKWEGSVAGLCGRSRPVGNLSSTLSWRVHFVSFWNECLVSRVHLCFVYKVQKVGKRFSLLLKGGERCRQNGLAPTPPNGSAITV